MSIVWNARGGAECDFRAKWLGRPLRLSLRTTKRREAQARHDAIAVLVRGQKRAMLEQLRAGVLTVERVTEMVAQGEPLVPVDTQVTRDTSALGTVREASERYVAWMQSHPKRQPASARNVRLALRRFAAFEAVGDTPVVDITSATIDRYQQSLIAAGLQLTTVTAYMTHVPALWRWLQRQEDRAAREGKRAAVTIYSPADRDRLVHVTAPRQRFLSMEEMARLMTATPAPFRFPVLCGLLAGLRQGEILHLRPGIDVDVEAGTISIREQDGWTPKTRRSIRTVPMARTLWDAANRHLLHWASASWMLPGTSDTTPLRPWAFDRDLRAIVERAGLITGKRDPQGVTTHTLRHTWASHAVMAGADLYTVSQLMGDTVETVVKNYAHLSPDHKRRAMELVEKLAAFTTHSAHTAEDTGE